MANSFSNRAERMSEWVRTLQLKIISALEQFEPSARFQFDEWQRPGGGGGTSGVLINGSIFEKAGVNFSKVMGVLPEPLMKKLGCTQPEFFATGVSLVIHPFSPQVPTVHANFRYFEQAGRAWFGGGADLTPYTVQKEDFHHFHKTLKDACDPHGLELYPHYKKECDEYFFLPHRGESRGIGGIFFDYLENDLDKQEAFVKSCGEAFVPAYIPIVEHNYKKAFTPEQKKYQLLRRGRYVEFNLVYDRGTLFGLQTNGNSESILMSLPPVVEFGYKASLANSPEETELMGYLRKPQDWVAASK